MPNAFTKTASELSIDDYHKDPALGSSSLREFAKNKTLYAMRHISRTLPPRGSPQMDLGNIIDSAILEPEKLASMVAVIPREVLNKDGHRKGSSWTEWAAAHGDKCLLTPYEYSDVRKIIDSTYQCYPAAQLLRDCTEQLSVFWDYELPDGTCIPAKCRYDGYCDGGFFDLKTTSKGIENFTYAVKDYDYLTQAAWYAHGFTELQPELPEIHWIVVETTPPFECAVFTVPDGFTEWAYDRITNLMNDYQRCLSKQAWNNEIYQTIQRINIDLTKWRIL